MEKVANELLKPRPTRAEEDLDSICCGSPTKKQVKLYFNSRTDGLCEIQERINKLVIAAEYLESRLMDNQNGT